LKKVGLENLFLPPSPNDMGHTIIHAIPCHMLTALGLWNIIEMMCIRPRLVVVSKSEAVIIVLVVVIIVVM